MNPGQLIWKYGKRKIAYCLMVIALQAIFFFGGQQFTNFEDTKVLWPLLFESLFLFVITFTFRLVYKIDAAFLIFVLGVPVVILFTQISLLVHISSLEDRSIALAALNDLLMIFCLGAISSTIGYYLGGKEKIPVQKISMKAFYSSCLFFFFVYVFQSIYQI